MKLFALWAKNGNEDLDAQQPKHIDVVFKKKSMNLHEFRPGLVEKLYNLLNSGLF